MVVVREAKTFYFDFNWPKDADDNFKHKIEFIRKSNECLPDNNIKKNKTEQLLFKYKHGNNIHEHRKQKKQQMNHINLFLTCHKD